MVALMWVLETIDVVGGNLDANGIHPRDVDTLPDIAFAPFLHAGWGHLIGNTVPFLVLGGAIALSGLARTAAVTVDRGGRRRLRHVADRAGQHEPHRRERPRVRLRRLPDRARDLQPPAMHLGAGVAVIAVYGATLLFGFIPHPGVSWQGHLFGAVGGVVAARVLDRRRVAGGGMKYGPDNASLHVHTYREGVAAKVGHDLIIEVTRWEATVERRLDRADRRPGLARGPRGASRRQAAHGQGPAGDPQEHRRQDAGQLADRVPLHERRRRRGRGRADDGGRDAAREPAARDRPAAASAPRSRSCRASGGSSPTAA